MTTTPTTAALTAYVQKYADTHFWRGKFVDMRPYVQEAACEVAAAVAGVDPIELAARVRALGPPPLEVARRNRWVTERVPQLEQSLKRLDA